MAAIDVAGNVTGFGTVIGIRDRFDEPTGNPIRQPSVMAGVGGGVGMMILAALAKRQAQTSPTGGRVKDASGTSFVTEGLTALGGGLVAAGVASAFIEPGSGDFRFPVNRDDSFPLGAGQVSVQR